MPQTFRGAYLRSSDIERLALHAGWLDRINLRDSSDYQKMSVAAPNGRFNGAATSDRFTFLGGDYAWSEALTLRYYHAALDELYRKDFLGFIDNRPLGPGRLKSDLRLFVTAEEALPRPDRSTTAILH